MLTLYISMLDDPEEQRKFEQLYVSYRQMMFYTANKVLKDEYEAEDAVHQAFLRIMKHMNEIDENDEGRTKAFLTIVTRNIAIDMYRRRKRDRINSVSFDENEMFIEDPAGQDFENIQDDNTNKLAEAVQKLDPKYADVIDRKSTRLNSSHTS